MAFVYSLQVVKKLVKTFGVKDGVKLYLNRVSARLMRNWPDKKVFSLKIGAFGQIINLRIKDSDWDVFLKVFLDNEYGEPSRAHADQLERLYKTYLEKGRQPVILDCGANIGMATIWYARNFAKATIIAIEPEPQNFALLKQNTTIYKNVICLNAGISDLQGRLDLANAGEESWAWETVMNKEGKIEAVTIDNALSIVKNSVPLIVKIDIEGFEAQLFRSNTEWVGKTPLIVAETHDWLFPWKATAHAITSTIAQNEIRDYLQNGENTFYYSHKLLQPQL